MEALPPPLQKEVERLRLAPYRTSLENMRKALHAWKFDRELIRPAVAPTIPLHCSDEFMTGCGTLAREYGAGLQTHLSESKVQAVSALKKYGKSLAAHMDALGLVGPAFTAAHGVWLDDDDMKRLAGRGASVAHNPGSNMRLGSGIADMRRMLECGINVGIGTDGASSSDNLNMYEAMRIASLASKVRGPEWERWITTKEVLDAATTGSARALGFEKLGCLAPGYKADLVFLDLGNVNWIPLNDAVNALVHTEDGSAVHSVMVGGRMVLENRRLANLDLAKLARDAESARERLERLNRDNKALYQKLEPIVGSFCPALAKQPLHINRYAAWR
jgi:guanine deaminase